MEGASARVYERRSAVDRNGEARPPWTDVLCRKPGVTWHHSHLVDRATGIVGTTEANKWNLRPEIIRIESKAK